MKPISLFLSGFLLGVCITVGVFYLRGPAYQQFLSRRAASPDDVKAAVALRSNESSLGSAGAPVTMVEYSDFQCPYCAMFRTQTFPKIKAKYIDSGQLRFIHRHLPMPYHAQAMMAAKAAACAGDQGLYWELSSVMFSRTSCLECQGVVELSKAVPLDRQRFEKCVSSNSHHSEIDQDIASARQLNFDGTPSFVVGRTTPTGVEGIALVGALPFEEFAAKIDQFIAKPSAARR
jgi:protein-disulfide isomerase